MSLWTLIGLLALTFLFGSAVGAALAQNVLGAVSCGVLLTSWICLCKQKSEQESRYADIKYAFEYLGLDKCGFYFDLESRVFDKTGRFVGIIVPNQRGVYEPKNFPSLCYAYEGDCQRYVPWNQRFNPPPGKQIRNHDIAGYPSIYHGHPYIVRNDY